MRRILTLAFSTVLTGCMVGPDYHQPAMSVPAGYKEAPGWVQAQPADAAPKGPWWQVYNDAELNKLEPLVAVNNQTLAADYAAFEQAEAITDEVRGGLFPTIGLTSSATRAGNGGGGSSGSIGGASNGPKTSGTFEGSVSWSPDIWGKIRRQLEADRAAAQVSAADLANATLSEQALLATDYVDLRGSDSIIALLTQTVAAYQRSLQIAQNQFNAGVATPLDVITARTQLEGAQAQLISAGEARAQYEHAIAVLVGHAPADLSLPAGAQIAAVPEIPVGVPSVLLQRRPDIAAAERLMAENNAQIGVAEAAFYPTISLTALGGYSANPISGLFSVSNALWSLGSNVSETLFDGGTRSATVAAAKFGYQQSVATYRQTVLTAFQQVEDGLSDLRILAQQAVVEQAAVSDAGRAVQIALNEYQAGTQAYTTVVTAQATYFSDQQTALNVQQSRLLASIALIQALGGGWQLSDLPQ
ncbi:MAG: RND transporter [Acidocella sp. 20-57-95]|nr:MAG: RND transporter [Acidocella sp. 20-57-95]HQT64631.1 efflux transporter outer membrane subunit [Acidocella sp.]